MKVVIRCTTTKGDIVAEVDWERQLVLDFAEGFKKAAMLLGDQALIITMSKAGIAMDIQHSPKQMGISSDAMQ